MSNCIKTGLRYRYDEGVYAADLHVADDDRTLTIISVKEGVYGDRYFVADVEVLSGLSAAPGVFIGELHDLSPELIAYVYAGSGVRLCEGDDVLVVMR